MNIKSVEATWLHVPIPEARQHVSDFGRMTSFDSVLVRIETECGIVGHGEAKEEVGSAGNCHAIVALINRELGPLLTGQDPRDAIGPDIGLMCDAHGTYSVTEAKQFCRQVEDCNLTWFEEPVTADDKRGMAEVRASTSVPIAAGMHVAAASPAGFILEYSVAANPLLHELVEEKFTVKDGMIEIPERPGLGLTIKRDFVKRYAAR